MKKLFLSSSFKDVAHLLPNFVSDDLTGKTVTLIPTAALHEKMNFYVKSGKKSLEKMGMIVDELEISTTDLEEITRKLQENDYIYVTGGNTFFLLQELQKAGADKIIKEQIEAGKIYIGESAGSMILSPNIEYAKDMDDFTVASDLKSFEALNIIDFYPVPHKDCVPFKKTVETIILKYSDKMALSPITNSQTILVNGNDFSISE